MPRGPSRKNRSWAAMSPGACGDGATAGGEFPARDSGARTAGSWLKNAYPLARAAILE